MTSDYAKSTDIIKEVEKGDIKGGFFEGKLLSKQEIKTFASLPSREVLLGQIAGLLVANTRAIAGIFESLIRDIALLSEEVAKKKG
jgi:large subunit ribosomal protein L10